ncbi:IDEAL domain-containing protein [Virgibacillus salinus]|uniref:IDEAL domain-containing protein n=1 Tax=Virgibacillus salinus TaxID=553311 RepID=A0A1H0ZAU8_9BACI|nr:IDEAL domain-containing protein [Virgibacillus salinus]SDQ24534.1 IDEAL domain-containing protein [Virgibacillus salinus]
MVTVKMLKPYYIKADDNYVRVILAYQYFAVFINNKVYQFVPIESKEIRINRRTKKVENLGARFAFQKGKDIIYMAMSELISLPDFLVQLHSIADPYYLNKEIKSEPNYESEAIIDELEQLNMKRLIDKALDNRDYEAFQSLVKLL